MTSRGPRPLAAAVDALTADLAPATALATVQQAWPAAVGDAVAAQTEPVRLAARSKTLTVACSQAVWAQELHLMSAAVVAALEQRVGAGVVRDLRCQVAPRRP
jgi:predicted nucleic acid-binding Zn ribbon protein